MYLVCTALMLAVAPSAKAQFVVTDPANLASGILNSANEIVQTSSTVSNVIKNFNEVKKVYEQGKEYYDKLKAVNNLVKDARKVQQTVLLVGDVSEMYVQNFGKMMNDPNFTPQELVAIGNGYSALLNESTELLKELKQIVSAFLLLYSIINSLNIRKIVYIVWRTPVTIRSFGFSVQRFYLVSLTSIYFKDGLLRFELKLAEPKSAVLPLHHSPMYCIRGFTTPL